MFVASQMTEILFITCDQVIGLTLDLHYGNCAELENPITMSLEAII